MLWARQKPTPEPEVGRTFRHDVLGCRQGVGTGSQLRRSTRLLKPARRGARGDTLWLPPPGDSHVPTPYTLAERKQLPVASALRRWASCTAEHLNMNRPCLSCGTPSPDSRCPGCCTLPAPRDHAQRDRRRAALGVQSSTSRGYDGQWRRLSERARRAQPFCSDCGHWGDNRNPLTTDHLRWPARTLADVEVVCRSCNSKRGARRASVSAA